MRTEHRITIGLLLALLAQPALRCQTPDWQAGIVQVKNSNLSPGTGFIVAFRSGRALIVTAAHVVEGDNKPKITFQGNRDAEFTATVLNQQVGEMRGFALLEVRDPPTGLRILEPQPGLKKPAPGTSVTVVGYPASVGVFSVVPSTVTATQAADLLISPATEEGFSGGPILIDGRVAGMTYGKQGAYGKAVAALVIDSYLRVADPPIDWTSPALPVAPVPGPGLLPTAVSAKDGMTYVSIPPGTFTMGCSTSPEGCSDDSLPAHKVTITKGFWMGQTEATVGAWKRFARDAGQPMPDEPRLGQFALNPGWRDNAKPIVNINWSEAQAFCKWTGGRLPTEAEWEYAARANNPAASYGTMTDIGWFAENSGDRKLDLPSGADYKVFFASLEPNHNSMKAVGLKLSNDFLLNDMLGNVSEWTADFYDENYYKLRVERDPKGPVSGMNRVSRGGGFHYVARLSEVADRNDESADGAIYLGFRCVAERLP